MTSLEGISWKNYWELRRVAYWLKQTASRVLELRLALSTHHESIFFQEIPSNEVMIFRQLLLSSTSNITCTFV